MRNNTLPRPPARSRLRFVHLILISLLFPYSVLPSFRARLSIFRAGGDEDEDEKASEDNECIPLRRLRPLPPPARPQEVTGKVHAAREERRDEARLRGLIPTARARPRSGGTGARRHRPSGTGEEPR